MGYLGGECSLEAIMIARGMNPKAEGVDGKHDQVHLANPSDAPRIFLHPWRKCCRQHFIPKNISLGDQSYI